MVQSQDTEEDSAVKVCRPSLLTSYMYPHPLVIVTALAEDGSPRVAAASWGGRISPNPPLLGICFQPEHEISAAIKASGEFVLNMPTQDMVEEVKICDYPGEDKWRALNAKSAAGKNVKAPLILTCPVNVECKLYQTIPFGEYELIVGEMLTIQVDEGLHEVIEKTGRFRPDLIRPLAWVKDEYWAVTEKLLGY